MHHTLILALILLTATTVFGQDRVTVDKLINEINNNPKSKWQAEHNKFSDMSTDKIKSMLMPNPPKPNPRDIIRSPPKKLPNAPESFDSRTQWPQCTYIANVRDQGHCGSCWAFSGTEALGDRFCVASVNQKKPLMNILLSPQYSVSCDYLNHGCQGGMLDQEWWFFTNKGATTDACVPYTSYNGTVISCPTTCKDGSQIKDNLYYSQTYHHIGWYIIGREKAIMNEVAANGPVQVSMAVYRDFLQYKSGVYHRQSSELLGYHAIKLVGWGKTEDGTKYWIIANSWGVNWGMHGFFLILRGVDEVGIEAGVYAGPADFTRGKPSQ